MSQQSDTENKVNNRKIFCSISIFLLILLLVVLKYNYSPLLRPKVSGLPGLLRQNKVDFLFVGSSLTGQSIDIKSIESSNGISAYNLSYNSLNPAVAAELLNYVINYTNILINTVVMEAYPYKILVPFVIEDTRLFTDSPAKLKNNLIRSLRSDGSLPLSAYFELVVTAENESLITFPVNNKIIEPFLYKGAYINKIVPGQKSFRKKELISSKKLPTYNQLQYDAYSKIIEMCNKKKIRLVFVEPFLPKHTQESKGYEYAKRKVLEAINNSGTAIYESNKFLMDNENPAYFTDGLHLSSKGRELWTREIARILLL